MSDLTGLCECGCGRATSIATQNDPRRGYVKGQPKRFLRGHGGTGSNHYAWKGDEGSYHTIHAYLRSHYPKTGICGECGERKPTEYALIHGRKYTRNREDYWELCKLCHNRYDETGGSRWRGVVTAAMRVGEAPDCACGCGTKTQLRASKTEWRQFAEGHRWLINGQPLPERKPSVSRGPARQYIPVRHDPVPCAHCGKSFPPRRADMIFCGKACKAAARRASGVDDEERICHLCGDSFPINRFQNTRHCSKSCSATCQHAGGCPT